LFSTNFVLCCPSFACSGQGFDELLESPSPCENAAQDAAHPGPRGLLLHGHEQRGGDGGGDGLRPADAGRRGQLLGCQDPDAAAAAAATFQRQQHQDSITADDGRWI